jgi:uncharacterized protein (DUF983 family)
VLDVNLVDRPQDKLVWPDLEPSELEDYYHCMCAPVEEIDSRPEYPWHRLFWMLGNGLRLKCPTCGQSPIFVPWHKVRNTSDWFMPLDGCPRCGYPFDREPGYFLLSIFAINYGIASIIGLGIYLALEFWLQLPIWETLVLTILPIPFFNIWFARHSKALFIAVDLFFDPHQRDDDQGDQPVARTAPDPKSPEPELVTK